MKYDKFQEYERRAHSTVYSEHEGGFHDSIIRDLAQQFLPLFKISSDAVILDIGCGPGVFLDCARELGYVNTTGVTLSEDDHAVCQRKGFPTMNCSMSDLAVEDQSVDLIWCRHALEHSAYPLFTLYEFHRVLKDHGGAFVEVPAPDNERMFMHEFNPNHYSILGERMWQGLFEKSGFEVENFWVYNHVANFGGNDVTEKSLIFQLKKSSQDLAELFLTKYGLSIVK